MSVTAADCLFLGIFVMWSLWLLVFVVDTVEAKSVGLFFLGVGVILSLLHRPAGWLMFKISRAVHIHQMWEGAGQEGAQASYLAFGLVLIGIGCIYVIRSFI